jgi:hypothetical protein
MLMSLTNQIHGIKSMLESHQFSASQESRYSFWNTRVLQAGRPRVQNPIESVDVFNFPNPTTIALGLNQPLTKISTRDLPGRKLWPECNAGNLTAFYIEQWSST